MAIKRTILPMKAMAFLLAFVVIGGQMALLASSKAADSPFGDDSEDDSATDSGESDDLDETDDLEETDVSDSGNSDEETTEEDNLNEENDSADDSVENSTSSNSASNSSSGAGVPDATVVSAESVKLHHPLGGAGNYYSIPLSLSEPWTSEPREGGVEKLIIRFDKAIGDPLANAAVVQYKYCNKDWATYNGPMSTIGVGDMLVLGFPNGLSQAGHNSYQYRVLMGSDVTSVPDQYVYFTALYGDTSNDGVLNLVDRSVVVGVWSHPTQNMSARTDIDLSENTDASDRQAVVDEFLADKLCEFETTNEEDTTESGNSESGTGSTPAQNGQEAPAAVLVTANSSRWHSQIGFQDIQFYLNNNPRGHSIKSESRIGGVKELVLDFDRAIGNPGPNSIGTALLESRYCTDNGEYQPYGGMSEMFVKKDPVYNYRLHLYFTQGLENAHYYRVTIGSDITSVEGQTVEFMVLAGDATSDGKVNALDRSTAVGAWTSRAGFSAETDFDVTGFTDGVDRTIAVGAWQGLESCNQIKE